MLNSVQNVVLNNFDVIVMLNYAVIWMEAQC